MIKKFLSQLNLQWRSYPTLIACFGLGLAIIAGTFYSLYEFKVHQFTQLDAKAQELQQFISTNEEQKNRLEFPEPPNKVEALNYAKKVPMEREVPRFLLDLENMADLSNVTIRNLKVDEVQPQKEDLVNIFLKELGTLAKDLKDQQNPSTKEEPQKSANNPLGLSGLQQRERVFVTDPETLLQGYFNQNQQAEQKEQQNEKAVEIPAELLEYIPFGMIRFHFETAGTYQQLADFLGLLQTTDRLVHIEKWEYHYPDAEENKQTKTLNPVITVDFKIFYYKEKIKDIPKLPALDIKTDQNEPIIAVPKSWIETPEATSNGEEVNPSEGKGSLSSQRMLESFIQSLPIDPPTKD